MPEDPTQPTGSGADSGASGGASGGAISQADLDRAVSEAARRAAQSTRDSLKAEGWGPPKAADPEPSPAASTLTLDQIQNGVRAVISQEAALRDAKSGLSQEFPSARKELFDAAYSTPEEMRAAVSASHTQEESYREAVRAEERDAALKLVSEKYGIKVEAPQTPPTEAEGGPKELTAKDVASLSFSEFQKLDPKVVERALQTG